MILKKGCIAAQPQIVLKAGLTGWNKVTCGVLGTYLILTLMLLTHKYHSMLSKTC